MLAQGKQKRWIMTLQFTKAVRKSAKLKLGISGPAGSGKTTAALNIAVGLGGKVALIDTENGSASLYADICDFDTLPMDPPYAPERFIDAIKAAERANYDTLIIDSMTHEWNGAGGCIDINEQLAQARYKGNTWSAWSETTPRHRAFLDAILQTSMHVICTMRSKTETVQEGGKVRKVGMKDEQRDGAEYEFAVKFELDHGSHLANATKDRTRLFRDPLELTPDVGVTLLKWLESGAPSGLSPEEVASYSEAIIKAATMDDLRKAFESATNAAKAVNDRKAIATFTAEKDTRKAQVPA
jgi:KaiC/GvpD/RAD55 family RecA-like ATPase